jgi:hypothetical protein
MAWGRWPISRVMASLFVLGVLGGCAAKPLVPFSTDTPPLALVPAAQAGVQDKRPRFREIFAAQAPSRNR